jgi:hypothetical protein
VGKCHGQAWRKDEQDGELPGSESEEWGVLFGFVAWDSAWDRWVERAKRADHRSSNLRTCQPTVNYEIVSAGRSDEEAKDNAKYAISIARKMGATIFLLPEDIVEVKSKMILTFVGSLMAVDANQGKSPV